MGSNLTMPCIVVSAVNFTEGGPLTVLRECLSSAVEALPDGWQLIALVHDADLIQECQVHSICIPSAKKSWFHRLYWEWFGFRHISKSLKPALWLSLHDITPRVVADRQAVYCHNPAPFYKISFREIFQEPKFLIFNQLYTLVYRAFIQRNYLVVVQQNWLRIEFMRRFALLAVVVAHPLLLSDEYPFSKSPTRTFVFLYPALPRIFKNIEILCEAVGILEARGISGFELRLTLDGLENRYAQWLNKKFGALQQVRFIGRQSKDEMKVQYSEASAVVFPSKLETWGLPITEAKVRRLPLLVADLPYAHETVGSYELVSFFHPESAQALSELMQSMIECTWHPMGSLGVDPEAPFAADWASLWAILTDGLPLGPKQVAEPGG